MSRYHEVLARITVDQVFAEYARLHPDDVRAAYGLSIEETASLVDRLAVSDPQPIDPKEGNPCDTCDQSSTEPSL
jgi:hypothetical protein